MKKEIAELITAAKFSKVHGIIPKALIQKGVCAERIINAR